MQRPSFGNENQHFRENQPKTLVFIPNLAQRRLRKGLLNPSPGPWDEWQEAGVVKRSIPYRRIQTGFLLLLADIDQSKRCYSTSHCIKLKLNVTWKNYTILYSQYPLWSTLLQHKIVKLKVETSWKTVSFTLLNWGNGARNGFTLSHK